MTSTDHNSSSDRRTIGDGEVVVFAADSAHTTVLSSAREAWKYRSFISYMTRRELRTTYLRSYLGWIWSLLNPVAEVTIFTIVFGVLLGGQRGIPDGANGFSSFPHFLVTGIAIWGFFRLVSSRILNNFMAIVRLRRKLYFPPIAAALSTALSTMVEALILLLVVVVFFAAFGHLSIHVVLLIPAALFAAAAGLGVGLALSVVNSKYRDVGYLYNIGLRLGFYLLPIIWPIQEASQRFSSSASSIAPLVVNNPFATMIEFGRAAVYYQLWPPLRVWVYLSVASFGLLVIGWSIFARSSADVAEGVR